MIPIYQVDAFSNRPFEGNPACVCLMNEERDDEWLQCVAEEMNLSETAFIWARGDDFHLRWFTPVSEVKLCGHATLATAHVLWSTERLDQSETATFETLSGTLTVELNGLSMRMDFPANPPGECEPPDGLLDALGVSDAPFIGASESDFLIRLKSESAVRAVSPDYARLKSIDARGVIVSAESDSEDYDIVSRFFAPAFGINEDPVTGSAHTVLAPYWSGELDRNRLRAYQASRRGGSLELEMQGDRVLIGGVARTVFSGEMHA